MIGGQGGGVDLGGQGNRAAEFGGDPFEEPTFEPEHQHVNIPMPSERYGLTGRREASFAGGIVHGMAAPLGFQFAIQGTKPQIQQVLTKSGGIVDRAGLAPPLLEEQTRPAARAPDHRNGGGNVTLQVDGRDFDGFRHRRRKSDPGDVG